MSAALTPLYATAAIVLALAGAGKLRSPAGTVAALRSLELPATSATVRAIAAAELVLAGVCLLAPSPTTAVLLAMTYAIFAAVALALARRQEACGCFGEDHAPASVAQSLISASIAIIALAGAVAGPHGIGWLLGRPPASAAVLITGIAGCAYAVVLAYRELPQAWNAWSRP
jgi:Methylamine utilisation protein MauE